jgi:hypothetical protein
MTITTTDTRPVHTSESSSSAPSPDDGHRRSALVWAAIAAAVVAVAILAVVTLTGGDDATPISVPPFNPQAEQMEREAHLEGNEQTYRNGAPVAGETGAAAPSDDVVPGSRRMPIG